MISIWLSDRPASENIFTVIFCIWLSIFYWFPLFSFTRRGRFVEWQVMTVITWEFSQSGSNVRFFAIVMTPYAKTLGLLWFILLAWQWMTTNDGVYDKLMSLPLFQIFQHDLSQYPFQQKIWNNYYKYFPTFQTSFNEIINYHDWWV